MKKRILALAAVLVLVAVLVVPMAAFADTGTTNVYGTITGPTVSVNVPAGFNWTPFLVGWNYGGPNGGSVSVTLNSANAANWQVTAQDLSYGGYMWYDSANPLANKLQICIDGLNYYTADTAGIATTGTNIANTFNFWAKQYVTNTDPAGSYGITITFTATITSYS